MNITFERAAKQHIDIIFNWLAEPHIMEFWDNSQEHKDDILNFIHDRQQHYFDGTTCYFVGASDGTPFCFILSDILKAQQDLSPVHKQHMSKFGHTISLDFGIGNKEYLNRGLAAPTLEAFVKFYHEQIDPLADTFFIDPAENNSRAMHVYSKAGFEQVGEFDATRGAFSGEVSYLMVKRLSPSD